jgi:hypothetical protein
MAYGFRFSHRLSGLAPTIQTLKNKDTETLTVGDMATLDTGEIDLAVTTDTAILGAIVGIVDASGDGHTSYACTDSTDDIEVITDADAVYAVTDANARVMGATLDLTGTTGAQTVTDSANTEFVVVAPSSATEETLVMLDHGVHAFN